jgi:hypothetical protein
VVTDVNGRFDYKEIDTRYIGDWQVRLTDFPNSPPVRLMMTPGTRYFVEFQMTNVTENLTTEDGSG